MCRIIINTESCVIRASYVLTCPNVSIIVDRLQSQLPPVKNVRNGHDTMSNDTREVKEQDTGGHFSGRIERIVQIRERKNMETFIETVRRKSEKRKGRRNYKAKGWKEGHYAETLLLFLLLLFYLSCCYIRFVVKVEYLQKGNVLCEMPGR